MFCNDLFILIDLHKLLTFDLEETSNPVAPFSIMVKTK